MNGNALDLGSEEWECSGFKIQGNGNTLDLVSKEENVLNLGSREWERSGFMIQGMGMFWI